MKKIKFGILIILIAIGGIALFQVGNICIASGNVLEDCTIQIPANSFSNIFTIAYQPSPYEILLPPNGGGYQRIGKLLPIYKISIGTNGDPLNLLILTHRNYDAYTHGGYYKYWGQANMIGGSYTFHHPGGGPFYALLENLSEDPVNVHVQIIQLR